MGRTTNESLPVANQNDPGCADPRRATANGMAAEDRARLRLALETAHLFTWELNTATRELTLPPDVERVLGFTLPTTATDIMDIMHPDDREAMVATFDRAIQDEAPFEAEYRFIHPVSGETLWIELHGLVFGDARTDGARIVGVSQNITERKLRELNAQYLVRLNDALRPLADPVAIQYLATRLLGNHLGANRVMYGELLPDGTALLGPNFVDDVQGLPRRLRVEDFDAALVSHLASGRTAVCDNVGEDSNISDEQRARFEAASIHAHVDVPLVKEGRLVGTLSVHQNQPRVWTGQDISIIEQTAERTWAAIARARAEERLRESENRYRTLFESIDQGFCVIELLFDADGTPEDYRFLEVNPAFERHTGLHGATGKTAREMVPNLEAHWIEIYANVALTGEPIRFVQEARSMEDRWFNVHAFRAGDPAANTVAILFTDITEAKRADDALRKFEEQLRRAIEIETVGVVFFRPEGAVTFANAAFLRMSGYTEEDVANGLVRWDTMTPPEWMDLSMRAIDEALSLGRSTPYEKQYFRKNGSRWWALSAAARIDDTEGVKFIIDISNAKRAEAERERLAAIIENSRDAVIGIDMEGTITDWNPAAAQLFGYIARDVVGRDIAVLIPPERLHEASGVLDRLSRQEHIEPSETVWARQDGTPVEVEVRPSPVLDASQKVIGAAVIARDATERKRLERAQEDFLAMASHDLRSPVTVLSGRAQLMKRRKAYDESGVDIIIEQARRIERLVADLQELVKLEAGGFELERTPVELGALARQAVDRARIATAGHALHVAGPDEPITGEWDRDRLGQVLDNLIGNAIKYSPDGGDITVRVERHGDEVRLIVTDDGPGIPADILPQLFERFYRGSNAGSATGLGLGLYITRMLVEAHGGRIWAESTVGRGSTFTVALPVGD